MSKDKLELALLAKLSERDRPLIDFLVTHYVRSRDLPINVPVEWLEDTSERVADAIIRRLKNDWYVKRSQRAAKPSSTTHVAFRQTRVALRAEMLSAYNQNRPQLGQQVSEVA